VGGERFLDLALGSAPKTRAASELCKRVRFRKSTCRTCIDVCPENAISLNPGPTISGSCADCGLCEIACPTEVFRNERRTDQHILAAAASFVRREPTRRGTKGLSVGCCRAELQSEDGIRVPCLGRVSENILLGAALLGFDEVVLIKGRCAECPWKPGEEVLTDSLNRSRALLELGGGAGVSIRLEEKERSRQDALPRRELFARLGRSLRTQMAVVLQQPGQAIGEALGNERGGAADAAPRWEHLRTLLRQLPLNGAATPHEDWFPWAKVVIDEARCSACGICAHLCPTGALAQEAQPGCAVVGFRPSRCTNCGLCQEACPEGAVRFEEQVALADAVDDEWHVLARVGMSECRACGNTVRAGQKTLCPTCEKRQVSLTHVELQRGREGPVM